MGMWEKNGLSFDECLASADDLIRFKKVKSLASNIHLKGLPSPSSEEWKQMKIEEKRSVQRQVPGTISAWEASQDRVRVHSKRAMPSKK
jgi:hypothetical protein